MNLYERIKFYFPAATDSAIDDFAWVLPYPAASGVQIEEQLKHYACKANSIEQAINIGYGEFDRIVSEMMDRKKKASDVEAFLNDLD